MTRGGAMTEHVCDPTIPVCACGHLWDYKRNWSDGSVTYTTEKVRQRYEALYGAPEVPFLRSATEVSP